MTDENTDAGVPDEDTETDMDKVSLMRGEFGRQLGLMSDRQNAMLVSIGILVAFASILFAQQILLLDIDFSEWKKWIFNIVSMILLLICCLLGILVIYKSSDYLVFTGMNIGAATKKFSEEPAEKIEIDMLDGLHKAYYYTSSDNYYLSKVIKAMVLLLLLGIVMLILGWTTWAS